MQSVAGSVGVLLWHWRRHFCNLLGWLLATPPTGVLCCVVCCCLPCGGGLLHCRSLCRNELTVPQQRTHLKGKSSKQRCRAQQLQEGCDALACHVLPLVLQEVQVV